MTDSDRGGRDERAPVRSDGRSADSPPDGGSHDARPDERSHDARPDEGSDDARPDEGSDTSHADSGNDSPADGGTDDPPADAVVTVEHVTSGYGRVEVLSDLSLHLRSDEIVCLIGPNGAGKSTVLRAVFGLIEPWEGRVSFRGEDVTHTPPTEMVRAGMGYVPQENNVFGSLSVTENLRMGGVSVDGVDDRIRTLRDRFPLLSEKASARAASLSGGQRQVVAFARALMTDPDVLLIDEPSAGLAPDTATEVLGHVERVNETGTAVMMVEQNAQEGLAIADRGYVLDQGTVRFDGPADGLLDDDEVARLYLGG